MMNLRKCIPAVFFLLLLLPVAAQEQADTTYTFRFKAGKDMFYVPWSGNGTELERLEACVEKYRTEILGGRMPLRVDGYCGSAGSEKANLATAAIRSNRVKSELIVRRKLTEECFVTRNHAAGEDCVVVRITARTEPAAATDPAAPTAPSNLPTAPSNLPPKGEAEDSPATETASRDLPLRGEAGGGCGEAGGGCGAAGGPSSFYLGLRGGVPFGVSGFSSFGADKTRAGWTAGVYGGCRFGPVLSLEAQAAWGQVNLSLRDCCPDYWLGSDGVRYEAAVAGMQGWDYSALSSRAFLQSYAVQLNVNLLGFFAATRGGRWTLELAPRLAATGTKATLRTIGDGQQAAAGPARWHLGAGGCVQAAYAVTRSLSVGIYAGITCLTGSPLDGLPRHLHHANYISEGGIRLGWTFPTSTGKEARP